VIGKLKNYNKIVDHVVGKHDIEVDRTRAKMFVLYFGSILANMELKYINYEKLRENDKTINFYGLMFLSSGSGKDFGKNILVKGVGDKIIKFMSKTMNDINDYQIRAGDSSLPEKYKKKTVTNYKVPITNTDAGLYMNSLLISSAMFGSLNIEINEFGDVVSKGNQVHLLNELYDGELDIGQIQGEAEEESRMPIYDLKTNMFAYGSFNKLKSNKKLMDSLIDSVKSGLFRRSYIYFEEPTKVREKEKQNIDLDSIIDKYFENIKENLIIAKKKSGDEGVKGIKTIGVGLDLSEEAEKYIEDIRVKLINNHNDNLENELIAVDMASHITILKVAAIIAVLNLDNIIDKYHIEESYDIFKTTRKTTEKLFELKPDYEILYSRLLNRTFPRYYLKALLGVQDKGFDETLTGTKGYCGDKNINSQLYTKVKSGVVSYSIRKLEETNEIIDFSYNVSSGSKPEYTCSLEDEFVGSLDDFNGWIENQQGMITLSTSLLSEEIMRGYKTNKSPNNVKEISVIVFDFDETLTSVEIKNRFQGVNALLRQSKNWSETKHKYHLYVPLKYKIKNISKDEYKEFYENICLRFGITDYADDGLKSIVHTVDESPEKKGKMLKGKCLDPRCCLPYTDDYAETERIYSSVRTHNRVTGYISTFINDMVYAGSNRTAKINTWIYKFIKELENKPTRDEMLEGLEWIYNIAKEKIGKGEPDRKRFVKMINENFE